MSLPVSDVSLYLGLIAWCASTSLTIEQAFQKERKNLPEKENSLTVWWDFIINFYTHTQDFGSFLYEGNQPRKSQCFLVVRLFPNCSARSAFAGWCCFGSSCSKKHLGRYQLPSSLSLKPSNLLINSESKQENVKHVLGMSVLKSSSSGYSFWKPNLRVSVAVPQQVALLCPVGTGTPAPFPLAWQSAGLEKVTAGVTDFPRPEGCYYKERSKHCKTEEKKWHLSIPGFQRRAPSKLDSWFQGLELGNRRRLDFRDFTLTPKKGDVVVAAPQTQTTWKSLFIWSIHEAVFLLEMDIGVGKLAFTPAFKPLPFPIRERFLHD